LENDEVKILWDFTIQTEKKLDYNKPDLVILNKKEKTTHIVAVGCPFDKRVKERERTKIEKYTDLA
jgi:nitrogenase molybdenum-iron protein alpha/beta subunit